MVRKIKSTTITKYLNVLNQLYTMRNDDNLINISLSEMCYSNGLSVNARAEIVNLGIIELVKRAKLSSWIWKMNAPDEKMAIDLINAVNKKDNIPMMHFKNRGIDYNDFEKKAKILSDKGNSQREIARQLNISLGQVNKFLNPKTSTQLTLSEQIMSAFPEYSLFELKAAIDKLI